jgi:hypothetical protein
MTDLNKLLYVANIVEPDTEWEIINGRVRDGGRCLGFAKEYEPHKPTERGRAQLTDIFFALMEAGWHLDITRDKSLQGLEYFTAHIVKDKDYDCAGETKTEAIINLAAQVL